MTCLVLIPGSLEDARVWRQQAEALSSDCFTVHCVERVVGFDALELAAQSILERAPARFAVAGHALGARIALELFRMAPERLERIALISGSVAPVAAYEPDKRQEFIDLAHECGMPELARRWLPTLVHVDRRADPDLIGILTAMAVCYSPADYEREARMLLARPDQTPILPRISCPALVLAGDSDPLSTAERNEAIAAAIGPHADQRVVAGCGHVPMREKPEETTAILQGWLAAA